MSYHQYKYVVRLYNSCDCEICVVPSDSKKVIDEVVASWLDCISDGDRIEFEINEDYDVSKK